MEMVNRKIVISQPINDGLAGEIIAQIIEINDLDAHLTKSIVDYSPEPIVLFINSGGGSATAGFAIIGAMEMSETPIITYAMGIVASMALGIFVSGDVRIAHRFCRLMYHSVAYGEEGYIQDHEDAFVEAGRLQKMYNSIFLDKTKLTAEQMADIREKKKNFFFSGKQAVKLGMADDVVKKPEPKIEMMSEEEYEKLIAELEEIEEQENK